MALYDLNELEADELYHSLVERKGTLEARAKSLGEKDGLPEAADAVRERIKLYMPSGQDGSDYRPGLIRLFAPQRDLDAERQTGMKIEERAADGGQDLFGGGAETGGGTPAGQTEPAKGKRGRKKKGEPEIADAPAAIEDPVEVALGQLAALAVDLLAGDATIPAEIYRGYAVPVLTLLPTANPAIDAEFLKKQVDVELADASDNAHALAYYVQRNVDIIRDLRERPIGRREEAHGGGDEQPGISNAALPDANAQHGTSSADGGAGDGAASSVPPLSFAPSVSAEEGGTE